MNSSDSEYNVESQTVSTWTCQVPLTRLQNAADGELQADRTARKDEYAQGHVVLRALVTVRRGTVTSPHSSR